MPMLDNGPALPGSCSDTRRRTPTMKQEDIQKAIVEGPELAVGISVDTCIYERHGLHLEGGLLLRLEQFRESPSSFLVSDVVQREVLKHLELRTLAVKNALAKAIKDAGYHWQATPEARSKALEDLVGSGSSKDWARARLDGFFERCGAKVVLADDEVKVGAVMTRYFASSPPFEASGDKKSEFPDAVALMSLEGWARKNSKPTVVVSADKGWKEFADSSPYLYCAETLEDALELFQRRDATRAELVRHVGALLEQDSSDVLERLRSQLTNTTWWPEASSYFENDIELEVQVESVAFAGETAGHSMRAVDYRWDELTVVADFVAELEVDADIGFSYDGTSMGGCSVSRQMTIEFEALITFDKPSGEELAVLEAELVRRNHDIDLGDVAPDESEGDPDHERY